MFPLLRRVVPVAVLVFAAQGSAWADAKLDVAMKQLAAASGCVACHSIESGKPGPAGVAPIGPAWQDVAARYKGQEGVSEKLLKTVMEGSNPYASHWKGKVSGLAMPPNAVAIQEADARKLVQWILDLKQ